MTHQVLRTCLNSCILLLLLLKLQPASGQVDTSRVEEVIDSKKAALGGKVALAVWKNGKMIYTKEIGEDFKVNTRVPVTYASKWFATATIMTLVDQGKLSLDDRVAEYIPVFAKYAKGYITIRDCLFNTTGLEAEADKVQKFFQRKKFENLEEEVNFYASKKEIQSNPGTDFHYGNIGINIAARVAEIVSKKGFDRLAQEKIFRPLQMRNTTYTTDDNTISPATGATSSAADFVKFLGMILSKGTFNGRKILSEEAITQMHTAINANLPIKYLPRQTEGLTPGLGVWLQPGNNNQPAAVYNPGIYGTFPYIDIQRNYAAVITVPNQKKEDNRDNYLAIKDVLDEVVR